MKAPDAKSARRRGPEGWVEGPEVNRMPVLVAEAPLLPDALLRARVLPLRGVRQYRGPPWEGLTARLSI